MSSSTYRGLRGKTAVVTGGAQGIGAATVRRLAEAGCRVAVFDIRADLGDIIANELCAVGYEVRCQEVDVNDAAGVAAAMDRLGYMWESPSFLVNCAAGIRMRGVDATAEDWQVVLGTTVVGMANVVKAFAARVPQTGGSIVNIASISAHIAQPGYLTYNTSKAAVLGFTRCAAQELAPLGVRVNSVSPGTVWNDNNAAYHRDVLGLDRVAAEAHPEHGGRFLLRRFADPEEIAAPVAFLLSSDASFITATDLVVDAG